MPTHAELIWELRNDAETLATELEVLNKEIETLRARHTKVESHIAGVRNVIWALERLQKVEANE